MPAWITGASTWTGALGKRLAASDVTYVSAIDALCTSDGCLTVSDGQFTQWDATHLTDAGSAVVARELIRKLGVSTR